MIQLDYDTITGNEAGQYRGYTITAQRDECASNPWEDWDCNPPIVVWSDGYKRAYGVDLDPPQFTREQIKAGTADILRITECDTLRELISEWAPYDHGVAWENINDSIAEYVRAQSRTDQFNVLPELYALAGIKAYSGTATGHSQGHWCEVLVVATPEWLEATGATIEQAGDLSTYVDLYGSWAFGDVYGYVITDADGECVDSCWGYYGSDHGESGLIQAATEAADYTHTQHRRERLEKLRALIRAHVPLQTRANIMRNYQ